MTIQPDESEHGGQTVTGEGWPHIDEDVIAGIAQTFEDLADHIRDEVVSNASRQKMALADRWEGSGAQSALEEAGRIVSEHEKSESAAKAVASKLRRMEFAIAVAKTLANQTAEAVQRDCEAIEKESAPPEGQEDTRQEIGRAHV